VKDRCDETSSAHSTAGAVIGIWLPNAIVEDVS
jgi:hypothetical protein